MTAKHPGRPQDLIKITPESRKLMPSRGEAKSKKMARLAIAKFVDQNADRLQEWLDEIVLHDGPRVALQCFADLIEFHVPKLSRTEVTGEDEGPVKLVIKWDDGKGD